MDKKKLKLIVQNLESLVECLKSEIYSDIENYKKITNHIEDYDEVFYDDEDDLLNKSNQKYKLTNDDDGDGL